MTSQLSFIALLIFPLLMAFAAASDLLTMRISNKISLALALGFIAVALLFGLPLETIGMHLACGAAVLVVGFTFFALGWIGGGDAKFAAATTLWIGFGLLLQYLLYASLLGGALTLVLLGARRWPLSDRLRAVTWIDRLHNEKTGVPYGIALAIAGLLVYADSATFQHMLA